MTVVTQLSKFTGYLHVQTTTMKVWKRRYFVLRGRELSLYNNKQQKLKACIRVQDAARWYGVNQGFIVTGVDGTVWKMYAEHESKSLIPRLLALHRPQSPSQKNPAQPVYAWLEIRENSEQKKSKRGYFMRCNSEFAHYSINLEGIKATETGVVRCITRTSPREFKIELSNAKVLFACAETEQEAKMWCN